MPGSRQLAAIMFTDIVGFTALMGSDEEKTFRILDKNRGIHKPIIAEYRGRWIKELGDGVMASFNNISDAVNAAIAIQEACNTANEYQLSIGIHSDISWHALPNVPIKLPAVTCIKQPEPANVMASISLPVFSLPLPRAVFLFQKLSTIT